MSLDTLLDNFNRANENPLSGGGNWTRSGTFRTPFELFSNGVFGTSDGQINQSDYTAGGDLNDCDVAVTFTTVPSSGKYLGVSARQDPGTNTGKNAYDCIYLNGTGILVDYYNSSGSTTTLATYVQTVNDGDSIGLRVQGTTLTAYYKASGGSWTALGSVTDSNLSHGYIGVTGSNLIGGGKVDDFSGGLIAKAEGTGWASAGLVAAGTYSHTKTVVKSGFANTDGGASGSKGLSQQLPGGRVMIAFDDGPLEPLPTWTVIDQAGDFPDQFVSGYDIQSGRQTLLSQTDTGTASVYINDHKLALFDPRNTLSPYFGKLDGKQILLQLYDPEAAAWEGQFRGLIDDITWDIDGSAVKYDADGNPDGPINASIQIDCVDMFDYLAGFGLTPGLDGVTPRPLQPPSPPRTAGGPPPAGYEDGVYYAETTGTVDDRIIEILADAHIDSTRYTVASGNVSVKAVKYDPDESALQALRDAADAELPFIANIYCDRHGDFLFRGRYSSFDPDATAAEPGSTWDFQRWFAGDGASIEIDPTRAQLRAFAFGRNRSDLINVAICYPQGMKPAQMPNQVFANDASILAYGKHSAPPMSDLLTNEGSTSPTGFTTNDHQECYLFAKLTVLNQKDPRENIKTLTFKAIRPDGSDRSIQTWALITRADISHNVNVQVGYPAGYGFAGDSPEDDYRIQGRKMQVRPLNPVHDYAELDLAVTPAVWSMDVHGVFPAFPGAEAPALMADFTVAE